MPEYPDHDHRSGNLINPEGYMFLMFHDENIIEDTEEGLLPQFTAPEGTDEEDEDHTVPINVDDLQSQTSVDTSDDNQNIVDEPDTIVDSQTTVDDSIDGNNVDDVARNTTSDSVLDSQDMVGAFDYSEVNDNILSQLDGNGDSSESDMDEDEFNTDNMFHLGNMNKRPRLAPVIASSDSDQEDLESQSNVSEPEQEDSDSPSNGSEQEDFESPSNVSEQEEDSDSPSSGSAERLEVEDEDSDPGPQASTFQIPKEKIIVNKGREHVIIPNTGPSYIFNRSHRAKPSTIYRHCNDLISLSEIEPSMKTKPILALILDDGNHIFVHPNQFFYNIYLKGADWGGRSLLTLFYLGKLFIQLNLDLLLIGRNAPGDSKWNPIERFVLNFTYN